MFSNITDAWANDPVKDITNKLSNGAFQNHNDHENIFNFKKQNFIENKKNIQTQEPISLSENLSLSLLSENTDITDKKFISDVIDYSDAKPVKNYVDKSSQYAKIAAQKKYKRSQPKKEPVAYNFTDTDSSNLFDSIDLNDIESKKQDRYYYQKIKKILDDKINKRLDDLMLENKLKQIENFSQSEKKTKDNWKDLIYIIIAVVIVVLIIFLVFKCLH